MTTIFNKLEEPSWLEATLIIESYLVVAYSASKNVLSLSGESGVELLIRPQIEEALAQPGLSHHLEEWLKINSNSPHYEIGVFLYHRARNLGCDLPHVKDDKFKDALKDAVAYMLSCVSSIEKSIFEDIISILESNPDYNRARMMINAIILNIIKFVTNRIDTVKSHDPSVMYLYSDSKTKSQESDLQKDLHRWLYGTCGAKYEISDVSGGRSDIFLANGNDQVVIEVKKEEDDSSFDSLERKYINQTIVYQTTNIRIGFLAILDLTLDRSTPSPHITQLFEARVVTLHGNDNRHVLIFKVPGNRQYPSDYSKKTKKLSNL